MILHQALFRHAEDFERLVRIKVDPSEFEKCEEFIEVFCHNDMHVGLLLVVENQHDLVALLVMRFYNVMKILDF